ncbi:uncharacterized protein LOC132048750 [Lycium ferocissimum]|uniref:uncharacterized protein LOC132048750 n=1 Tax=Lycium ferocissimum TaxID=112874 RepID=UPI0028162DCB|nr:uncharacterized protein LOC132048750 [Lycium ferocissimum]
MEVQTLAKSFVRPGISDSGRVLSCVEARSSLLDQIKANQFEDAWLRKIRDKVLSGEAKEVFEDMLRACVIDFGGHWDQFLPLTKFAYSNGYHLSIDMAPFEAFYRRRCRSPIGWFDAFEVRPWGTDLLGESLDKVKVSPMKGVMRFGKKGKISPRIIGPFEILDHVGKVAYELVSPIGLSDVHPVFHVSMLKKYHSDSSYIIQWDSVLLDENLSYEEKHIVSLDKEVRKLKSKEIASVKDQ